MYPTDRIYLERDQLLDCPRLLEGWSEQPISISNNCLSQAYVLLPPENETMKNASAFFCVLGVKHDLDGRLNCTLLCNQLRTPNFVVLEKLAMQIVDYDMLVHRGDWADCGSRLRGYIGALPEQASREVVSRWMSTVEFHPPPGIALKRSSCVTNEASADILLEALHAPQRAKYRKEKIIRPELQVRVQQWMQGVEDARQELQQSRASALDNEERLSHVRPTWPPTFGATTSIWAP